VFRKGRKPQLVQTGSTLAMLGAVFVVVDVVLHQPTAALIVAGLAVLYIFLWYVLPFLGRRAPTRPPGP